MDFAKRSPELRRINYFAAGTAKKHVPKIALLDLRVATTVL